MKVIAIVAKECDALSNNERIFMDKHFSRIFENILR